MQQVEEIGSGASQRPKREGLTEAARRRAADAVVVRKPDRRGRSLPDLIASLAELRDLGVAFASLTEAPDFTMPAGRAMIASQINAQLGGRAVRRSSRRAAARRNLRRCLLKAPSSFTLG